MPANKSAEGFDRAAHDVGNVQLLEHVNFCVPDQSVAALFYVSGLGFTRDPIIDFGARNTWVNVGDQQIHLPTGPAQVLPGHVGLVVPDLEALLQRLNRVAKALSDTRFEFTEDEHQGHRCLRLTCPYGNQFLVRAPLEGEAVSLGLDSVSIHTRPDTSAGIAAFYNSVMGCAAQAKDGIATVSMGVGQTLRFVETSKALPSYDGHHLAIYIADFSSPHRWLKERGLVSEESDAYQYRFVRITDPDSGDCLHEIEHEVRALSHPMYRRPLINRNPDVSFFNYRRGTDLFSAR